MRPGSPTSDGLDLFERHVAAWFGVLPARASVSFVGVEPIEVLRFDRPDQITTLVTLGMSRHPMTAGDAPTVSAQGPRAELALDCRAVDDVWRHLAVLAAAPAVEGVVHTIGTTIDLGMPLSIGSRCTGALIDQSGIPTCDDGVRPVDVLRVLPATATELAWCRVHGSAALRERWAQQSTDLLDLARAAVRLD